MDSYPPQTNPELIGRGMQLFAEDYKIALDRLFSEDDFTKKMVRLTVGVMGCDETIATEGLAILNAQLKSLGEEREELRINDSELATLVGLCRVGGKIQSESARPILTKTTGLESSVIAKSLKVALQYNLVVVDLTSESQELKITNQGVETILDNLDKVEPTTLIDSTYLERLYPLARLDESDIIATMVDTWSEINKLRGLLGLDVIEPKSLNDQNDKDSLIEEMKRLYGILNELIYLHDLRSTIDKENEDRSEERLAA